MTDKFIFDYSIVDILNLIHDVRENHPDDKEKMNECVFLSQMLVIYMFKGGFNEDGKKCYTSGHAKRVKEYNTVLKEYVSEMGKEFMSHLEGFDYAFDPSLEWLGKFTAEPFYYTNSTHVKTLAKKESTNPPTSSSSSSNTSTETKETRERVSDEEGTPTKKKKSTK